MSGTRSARAAGRRRWTGLLRAGRKASLLGVLASVALAGCGGDDDESAGGAGGGGKATLTFLHAAPEGTFDAAIAAFQKANPNITVKQQFVPFDDLNPTVQSRLGAKDPSIDVYHADEPRVPALAQRGFLADLSDMKDRVAQAVPEKAIAATSHEGKLYALPQWTSAQLLYFNKDLLRRANVDEPSPDPEKRITWEQLLADAKKAKSAGARWGFTFDQVDRYYQLQALPESLGGGSGLTGDKLLQPNVTTPEWTRAAEWYASTFRDGVSPRGVDPDQTPNLFATGRAAYFVGGTWNIAAFTAAKKLDFGVAAHPYFEGGRAATPTDSWAMGVSPFSDNQDEARKFAEFLTIDQRGATLSSQDNPNIPVQKQAFEEYLVRVSKQGGKATAPAGEIIQADLAETATSRPRTVGYVDFETVMNKAFADIRNGTAPAQRLEQASSELGTAFKRYGS